MTNNQVQCPICGDKFSSSFYLGQHISKSQDSQHTNIDIDQNSSSKDLGDKLGINSSSGPDSNELKDQANEPDNGDGVIEVETGKNEAEYIDLDPNDQLDQQLIKQGYSQVKKSALESGDISKEDLR